MSDCFPYPQRIRALALLSADRESELARRWRDNKEPAARDALIEAHLRCVVPVARKYARGGVPLDELIAEGNIGLMRALDSFDPAQGRFATYAKYWIRAYVSGYVAHATRVVSHGVNWRLLGRLRRERARCASLFGERHDARAEIAARLEVSVARVEQLFAQLDVRDVSLDAPSRNASLPLCEVLATSDVDPEQAFGFKRRRDQLEADVRGALTELDERERHIVKHRLSADSDTELTLSEIARQFGVSRERVRQLEARLKRKLKKYLGDLERARGELRWPGRRHELRTPFNKRHANVARRSASPGSDTRY